MSAWGTDMFTAAELAEHRADAESLMVDTFEAFAPGETTVVDRLKVTGEVSKGVTCGKIQGGSASTRDPGTRMVKVGGVEVPVITEGLHIPLSAPVPSAGDEGIGWVYECTAVGCGSEPVKVGRRYLVVGVPAKTYATARRLDVVELPPKES